jgi:hypothetical protein
VGGGLEGYFARMAALRSGSTPQDDPARESRDLLRQIAQYQKTISENSGVVN